MPRLGKTQKCCREKLSEETIIRAVARLLQERGYDVYTHVDLFVEIDVVAYRYVKDRVTPFPALKGGVFSSSRCVSSSCLFLSGMCPHYRAFTISDGGGSASARGNTPERTTRKFSRMLKNHRENDIPAR